VIEVSNNIEGLQGGEQCSKHNIIRTKTRAKTVFIHKNHEDVIHLPTEHNGVPPFHVCPTRHIAPPNEFE